MNHPTGMVAGESFSTIRLVRVFTAGAPTVSYGNDKYRDRDRDRSRDRDRTRAPLPDRPDLGNDDQVRRLKRGMERSAAEVIRCQKCGHQQQAEAAMIGPLSTCDKCGTALHSCKHCQHFMPDTRFQCRKPIAAAITDKWAGNGCDLFEPRWVLDATGRRVEGSPAKNAKNAFDALFKK